MDVPNAQQQQSPEHSAICISEMLLVAQASQLCETGRNVLEPVAVVMRNCSNLWHLLKVQLIPYFIALHDHGMDERSVQLLLLEIPACHPISQTAKDTFFPVYKALSASTPFTGNSLPQVSRIFFKSYKILCRAPFSRLMLCLMLLDMGSHHVKVLLAVYGSHTHAPCFGICKHMVAHVIPVVGCSVGSSLSVMYTISLPTCVPGDLSQHWLKGSKYNSVLHCCAALLCR